MRVNSIISNQKQQNFQGFRITGQSEKLPQMWASVKGDNWLLPFIRNRKIIIARDMLQDTVSFAVKPDAAVCNSSSKTTIEKALTRLFNKLKINFEIIPDKEVNPLIF